MFVVFDLLVDDRGHSLVKLELEERRKRLEKFASKYLARSQDIRLSPATLKLPAAKKWFEAVGGNLDGIVAKRRDMPYRSGTARRDAKGQASAHGGLRGRRIPLRH